jgi:hypothetical protein
MGVTKAQQRTQSAFSPSCSRPARYGRRKRARRLPGCSALKRLAFARNSTMGSPGIVDVHFGVA